MENTTKFIFLIPTYNRSTLIDRAIESILTNGYDEFLIYVCDDDSTDNTPKIQEKYTLNSKIKWVKLAQNSGTNIARNTLLYKILKENQQGYVVFMDDDNFLIPKQLVIIDSAIKLQTDYQWFLGKLKSPEGKCISKTKYNGENNYNSDCFFSKNLKNDFLHFIEISIIKEIKFTTQFKNAEEWYFFCQLAFENQCYIIDCEVAYCEYLSTGLSLSGFNKDKKTEVSLLKLKLFEHWPEKGNLIELKLNVVKHLLHSKRLDEAGCLIQSLSKESLFNLRLIRYKLKCLIYKLLN